MTGSDRLPVFIAMAPFPAHVAVAWTSIGVAAVCAVGLLFDLVRRPQKMGVMNFVGPLIAPYGGPLAVAAYAGIGRANKSTDPHGGHATHGHRPTWQPALPGATHCGGGCMLGDVITDGGLFLVGASALLGSALSTSFVFEFVAGYLLRIVFQYFAIVPMRHLSPGAGIRAAIKADTLSLVAFQIGMYAWMAIYQNGIFQPGLEPNSPVFWFMMQIGMLAGLAIAFPMNWFLVKARIKEAM